MPELSLRQYLKDLVAFDAITIQRCRLPWGRYVERQWRLAAWSHFHPWLSRKRALRRPLLTQTVPVAERSNAHVTSPETDHRTIPLPRGGGRWGQPRSWYKDKANHEYEPNAKLRLLLEEQPTNLAPKVKSLLTQHAKDPKHFTSHQDKKHMDYGSWTCQRLPLKTIP